MAAISDLLQGCLSQFTSVVHSDVLSHTEVSLQEWTDELGRLRVWAANIGAHQTRQSSLDYRLRDASHIKSQIVRLLDHVQGLLTDLEDVLGEIKNGDAQRDELEDMGEDSTTETQEIHQSLVETITQLYQMSMIIRNPAQHDRLVGTNKLDAEPFQFWAKQHTSTKYPNADALVIDRISSAMARQRAILNYRERHHAKLSQGIAIEGDGKSTMLSETVVTDVFQEMPGECSDMVSDAGMSETSYGGTLLEGTSADAPKIPPIPKKGVHQRPFECPYCFYIITVRDKRSWARHIFRDLMPYVCIFPECSTPHKLYDGRRQWYYHIQQTHTSAFSGNNIYDCSICRQSSLSTTTFQRHVGQHLEELALFLLPRTDSEEDENAVSDEENGARSSNTSLSDTSLDNYPFQESVDQRDNVANAAIPASNSDIDNDNLTRQLREKGKHRISSAGTSLSDKKIPGVVERDTESKMPGSTSPYDHDLDLNSLDQSLLDSAQDAELLRQQQAIDRLERELATLRAQSRLYDSDQSQLPWNNEKHEEEMGDQLRNLKMWETKLEREKLKQEFIEEEEKKERDKIKKDIMEEERRMATAKEEERQEKKIMRKTLTTEEYKRWEEERKMQEKEEAKKKDKESLERLRFKLGYAEAEIEKILSKEKDKVERHEKPTTDDDRRTWIKVHRKHLLPETLQAYNIPWDWDERENYIIIKQWITKDLQIELFAHTRRLRENKLVVETSNSLTGLGVGKSVRESVQEKMANISMQTPSPHRSPYWKCNWDGCHGTRFSREVDLLRHIKAVHVSR